MRYTFIGTHDSVESAFTSLSSDTSAVTACDVERAQGYVYDNNAYIVQIRRGKGDTFIFDTAHQPDMTRLSDILQDTTWVFHAADQDLHSLFRLNIRPQTLFDTKIAAEISGCPRIGLASLSSDFLGIPMSKQHQAENWSRRPVPPQWLDYAAGDVEYLYDLKELLTQRLVMLGRLEWFKEECHYIVAKSVRTYGQEDDLKWWKHIPHFHDIHDKRGRAIAYQLWRAREDIAKKNNIAPHWVLPNKALNWAATRKVRGYRGLCAYGHPGVRRYRSAWKHALSLAWQMTTEPPRNDRKNQRNNHGIPFVSRWKYDAPDKYQRLQLLNITQHMLEQTYRIPMHMMVSQARRQRIAWLWKKEGDVRAILDDTPARKWQKNLIEPYFERTLSTGDTLEISDYSFPEELLILPS
ncbi:MAG: hypothetical protein Q4P66_05665 [Actinomycetaceae bacterium]|nr:hypothetical protein [Actinomycetaceae bacterium]